MLELWGLATLSFVTAVTPGPNNVMLWASGVQFGLRKTVPHIVGITLGLGTMVLLVGAGFGFLIEQLPAFETALKILGSVYLLYLAYRIAGGGGVVEGEVPRPLTVPQSLTFQYVNPKAWVFVVAAVSTFRPEGRPAVVGSLLMASVMMTVVIPCATLWTAAGTALSRYLSDKRRSRIFRVVLGLLLAATVAYIWV